MNLPTPPLFIFQRQRQPQGLFSDLGAEAKAPGDAFQLAPAWLRGLQAGKQRPPRPMNPANPQPGASADSLAMMARMLTGPARGNYLTRNQIQQGERGI